MNREELFKENKKRGLKKSMKRVLSSTFVPLDLRKIFTCITHALIEDDFKENTLKKGELYNFYIYPDPTLEDGECEYMEEEVDDYEVFLCLNQYELLSQLSDHVLATRMNEMGPVEFDFQKAKGRCTFVLDNMSNYDDCAVWTFYLESWDFDRACYFGSDVAICPYAQNLPKDQLQWKGEAGMCKGKRCKEEDCERWIFCETHDAEHEEIHKL